MQTDSNLLCGHSASSTKSAGCLKGSQLKLLVLLGKVVILVATVISSPLSAQPRDSSVDARLASCDAAVVDATVKEILRDPNTFTEPLTLFQAAGAQRFAGREEEAAFLYLAARQRTLRQIVFEKGDRPQLFTIMQMTLAPLILTPLEADPDLARRVVKRTIDWDSTTPDPYRDRKEAKSGKISEEFAEIDAGLARFPDQIKDKPARVAEARAEVSRLRSQSRAEYAQRCGPGTLDSVISEQASRRIKEQAELLVQTHPLVSRRSATAPKSVSVGSLRQGANGLPSRLTVTVTPLGEKSFFAEVAAVSTVTPDRKLAGVTLSLLCLTDVSLGNRQGSWKDVCRDDPKAILSTEPVDDSLSQFNIGANGKSLRSPPICGFAEGTLPPKFRVLAAGGYSGRKLPYQIDQSGDDAKQVNVAVNSPDLPVALLLVADEPTVWKISRSKDTRIVGVFAWGYDRQAIAGLDAGVPLLVSSNNDRRPCGPVNVRGNDAASARDLAQRIYGQTADMRYSTSGGEVALGPAIPIGSTLVSSLDVTPESFQDKSAPLAGRAGLEDALKKGLIRRANASDEDAWTRAAGKDAPKPPMFIAYVILKPFTFPAGLYGAKAATFFVPKGVAMPTGNRGSSEVFDLNTLTCQGLSCRRQ
jgi:hypothetical protein